MPLPKESHDVLADVMKVHVLDGCFIDLSKVFPEAVV